MSNSKKKPKKELPLRAKVGWIAFGMAVFLVYGIVRYRQTGDVSLFEMNRMAAMMFLLWLAWPELERLPRWLFYVIPIFVLVCAWRPYLLIFVLPATLLYCWIRPPKMRPKKKR